jgi:hypothetical protein
MKKKKKNQTLDIYLKGEDKKWPRGWLGKWRTQDISLSCQFMLGSWAAQRNKTKKLKERERRERRRKSGERETQWSRQPRC